MRRGETAVARGPSSERLRAVRRGRWAEWLCLWHLRLRLYRVLARGYRVPSGEIDLIARRGRVIAAIEVKARPSFAEAAEAVTPRQRRRVERAFQHFLAGRPEFSSLTQRFDVMLVRPLRLPVHLRDAWRLDE